MVGKSNLPADAETRPAVRGSSLESYSNALDQERAASMSDEGGVSGAWMDLREHEQIVEHQVRTERRRTQRWLLAAGALVAVTLGALLVYEVHARTAS